MRTRHDMEKFRLHTESTNRSSACLAVEQNDNPATWRDGAKGCRHRGCRIVPYFLTACNCIRTQKDDQPMACQWIGIFGRACKRPSLQVSEDKIDNRNKVADAEGWPSHDELVPWMSGTVAAHAR